MYATEMAKKTNYTTSKPAGRTKTKTKLYTFQIYEDLVPLLDKKVADEFGNYKKSKVLNALIEGYLTGRYRIAQIF